MRRTQSAFVATTNSDASATFSGVVDVGKDDVNDDDDDDQVSTSGDKKVVMKIEDSDIEENRGELLDPLDL